MYDSLFSYFRHMDEADLDWVQGVEKVSYPFPWSRKGFMQILDSGFSFVLCDQHHQRLGYACFLTVVDEVQLLNLCVSPDSRNQKVAQHALLAFQKYFQTANFRVMQLEVRASNPAKQLYENLGFKKDGLRKGYYPLTDSADREDAVLMSWVLNKS